MTHIVTLLTYFAAPCRGGGFLGFPTWYKYLDGVTTRVSARDSLTGDAITACTPIVSDIKDAWLILAAVIEILLRIAAMLAVGFVLYGGIQYISSQGEPDKTQKARSTIVNALVGLVIAIGATGVITFVAGRFN